MVKLKNSKLIALFFATAFVLNACGSKETKQKILVLKLIRQLLKKPKQRKRMIIQ